jgi:Tol biopolymer transport system component
MNKVSCVWLLIALLTAAAVAQPAADADVELAAAIRVETVQGDIERAIRQYSLLADRYRTTDRVVAAKALVRLGQSQDKVGHRDARATFARILKEFADQTEPVSIARARLESASNRAALTSKKVWDGDLQGMISTDGRYLTFVHGAEGQLAIHDFATNSDRLLTSETGWVSFPQSPVLSWDSRQIAYAWFNDDQMRYELRVAAIPETGTVQPRVFVQAADISLIEPRSWSPDGKLIAATIKRDDGSAQIALVRVQDGRVTALQTTDWRSATHIFFSADGRYLLFDLPESDTSSDRDVHVLAVDGSQGSAIVKNPGQDVAIGWSPDGRQALFSTNRNGEFGLWSLPIRDGRAAGAGVRIKEPIESAWSMGITTSGVLYLGRGGSGRDINVTSVDLGTGKKLAGPTQPISTYVGTNRWFDWSRDGKLLAYVSERGVGSVLRENVIGIRSAETGELVRELHPFGFQYLQGLSWSPDGKTLASAGRDLKGRSRIFAIDANSGELSTLFIPPDKSTVSMPAWGSDGSTLFFSASGESRFNERRRTLMAYDVSSRRVRELGEFQGNALPSVSRDGKSVAVVTNDPVSGKSAVTVVSVATGDAKVVWRTEKPAAFAVGVGWAPNGRGLLVRKTTGARTGELFFVPMQGGDPYKVDIDVDRVAPLSPIRIHPDGRRVAFFSFIADPVSEVWALDNFLPASATNR